MGDSVTAREDPQVSREDLVQLRGLQFTARGPPPVTAREPHGHSREVYCPDRAPTCHSQREPPTCHRQRTTVTARGPPRSRQGILPVHMERDWCSREGPHGHSQRTQVTAEGTPTLSHGRDPHTYVLAGRGTPHLSQPERTPTVTAREDPLGLTAKFHGAAEDFCHENPRSQPEDPDYSQRTPLSHQRGPHGHSQTGPHGLARKHGHIGDPRSQPGGPHTYNREDPHCHSWKPSPAAKTWQG